MNCGMRAATSIGKNTTVKIATKLSKRRKSQFVSCAYAPPNRMNPPIGMGSSSMFLTRRFLHAKRKISQYGQLFYAA